MKAKLTVLGDEQFTLEISLIGVEIERIRIRSPRAIALKSQVRVVEGDCLWLGEVVEVQSDGTAIIEIVHALKNIAELALVAERFLGTGSERPLERYSDSLCPTEP